MDFLEQNNKRVAGDAMDFLEQNNKRVAGDEIPENDILMATDKNVVVIGGGDTGSDCVGTSNRHRAKSITQIELLTQPPDTRDESTPWPLWPMQLRTSSSHEEGCDRQWAQLTKAPFNSWTSNGKKMTKPDDFLSKKSKVLHPQHEGMLKQLDIALTNRGNVQDAEYQTNIDNIFVAGDMRRGQSLVVWAISEGREAARRVDEYLMGVSMLEGKGVSFLEVA